MNEASSRSHLVFAMEIVQTDIKTGKRLRGKCSLVDLAGSERADKTNVEGLSAESRKSMLDEGVAINESLRMLKNVFRILGDAEAAEKAAKEQGGKKKRKGKDLVQYRGNMLTELMQDSLGGQARTLMFVNVGPAQSNVVESIDSLTYGNYVNNISNELATKDSDFTEQIRLLEDKLASLKGQK